MNAVELWPFMWHAAVCCTANMPSMQVPKKLQVHAYKRSLLKHPLSGPQCMHDKCVEHQHAPRAAYTMLRSLRPEGAETGMTPDLGGGDDGVNLQVTIPVMSLGPLHK